MKPSQLAQSLKRIASGIENSKNPKKELVIRDLKKVLASANEEIKIKSFDYDHGDDRTYGKFNIIAETPYGVLVGKGKIGSGSEIESQIWTLDGESISSDVELPDLGIPHSYAGNRSISRFEKLKDSEIPEILLEWINNYMSDLSE